uniref:Large ribosomal subunit protein bL12c n=1 Tax=Phacus orbicularis TaxID=158829 RepID=A0A182B0Y3_9EUGL|nr:ribosomal protein L12 [Phacus orbicularis]
MSEKVTKILEDLKNISLLEASELITKIEETFNVQASFNVASIAAGPSLSNQKAEDVVVEEKTEFTVILKEVPTAKRINVIKVVRSLTALGLKEAKDLIETVPKPVVENLPKDKADEAKKLLEEAGAVVLIN